jgi:hypothetical protein
VKSRYKPAHVRILVIKTVLSCSITFTTSTQCSGSEYRMATKKKKKILDVFSGSIEDSAGAENSFIGVYEEILIEIFDKLSVFLSNKTWV